MLEISGPLACDSIIVEFMNLTFFFIENIFGTKTFISPERLTYSARYRYKMRCDVLNNKWKTVHYNQLIVCFCRYSRFLRQVWDILAKTWRKYPDVNLRDVRYVWKCDYLPNEGKIELFSYSWFIAFRGACCVTTPPNHGNPLPLRRSDTVNFVILV